MNKRNKPVIIMGIICLGIAGILFLVTAFLCKWDILGYFTTPSGIWSVVFVSIYLVFLIIYFVLEKWRKI